MENNLYTKRTTNSFSRWMLFTSCAVLCLFASSANAQTTLINPTGDGGFETGATFALNNWTAVNTGVTDAWVVGSVPVVSAGTNCAYVSANGGAAWTYSEVSKIVHLYKDVTIPAGETKMTLTFKWKATGEGTTTSDFDNLKVFFVPTSTTPAVGNNAVSSSFQISGPGATSGMYKLSSASYNSETIIFPTSLAGTTGRLIFSWKSDVSTIGNPPASIDEVSLTSAVPGNFTSNAVAGLWSATTTWVGGVVPSGGDNVTIVDGATVTLDVTTSVGNLTIGGGATGILQYDATARTLTAGGNVTINAGARFLSAASGSTSTVTTHALSVGGNLTNNGILNFSATAGAGGTVVNASGALITFTGATSNTFNVSGATLTNLRNSTTSVTLNKGTANTNVLTFTPSAAYTSAAGATNSTTTITVGSTTGLTAGMYVSVTSGTGVFAAGTTVSSITNGTQFVVSAAPTTALSASAVVTGSKFAVGSAAAISGIAAGFLTITNGTFEVAGTNAISNPFFTSVSYSIPATGGFRLNNANAVVTALGGSPTMSGLLRMTAGTYNVGTATGQSMSGATTSSFIIEGGTMNFASRLNVTSSGASFNMSAGTINICTVANASASASFGFTSATSVFTMSGGVINLVQGNSTSPNLAWFVNTTSPTITGGTLNVGTTASVTNLTFGIQGAIPTMVVDNTTTNKIAIVTTGSVSAYGNTTINSGATLNLNALTYTQRGATFTNNGIFALSTTGALSMLNFASVAQTIAGGGTVTGNLASLSIQNTAGVTITHTNQIPTLRVNLFQGTVTGSGKITMGTGLALAVTTQVGAAGLTTAGGSFDAAPTFNLGTGAYTILYLEETAARTTSFAIPATRTVTNLTVANANNVTLAGGALTVSGVLTLSGGKLITNAANLVTVTGTATTSVVRSSYTSGSLTSSSSGTTVTVGSTTGLSAGMTVTVTAGTGAFAPNTLVTSVLTATTFTVSATPTTALSAATLTGAGGWVSGPVAITLPVSLGTGSTYLLPVGKTSYNPIELVNPVTTAGGTVVMQGEMFTSNTGTAGVGVLSVSSNRWEAVPISGAANFTGTFIRISDAAITSTNKIIQAPSAAGAYTALTSTFTAGSPNTLITNTQIPVASYTGYFAYGDLAGCSGTPAASTISGTSPLCSGSGTTLALSIGYTDVGITYQWASGTTLGGPYPTTLGTAATQATGNLTVTTYYICTITCTNSTLFFTTPEKTVTVNPLPTVAVSPTSGSYCLPGGSAVALTASGASTYAWSPAAGLSATTGATVSASPSSTTTYTVSGTDANGCIGTATAAITVAVTPQNVTATATPSSICSGSTSNLTSSAFLPTTANNYVFATNGSTGTLATMVSAVTVVGLGVDDAPMAAANSSTAGPGVALPFAFNFDGTSYTFFSASPDGWMQLAASSTTLGTQFTNAVTSSTNVPKIYAFWDDLATGTDGGVTTMTTGTTPNRIFVVQWKVTIPRLTAGASNSTFQAWLYESSNKIEFHYGTMGTPTSGSISAGITGATSTNYNSITYSTNTSSNSAANDLNTTAPTSGRLYSFSPNVASLTYAWAPSGLVVNPSSQNTATNALTSTQVFTVTASNSGCTATATATVTIASGSPTVNVTPAGPISLCTGGSQTLTANASGGGQPYTYLWSTGATTSTISVNTTGSYSVVVTDACTLSATSNTVSVTVNPIPTATASSNSPVCSGGTLNLTCGSNIGTAFSWTGPNTFTSSSQSPSITGVTVAASGVYTVTASVGGCSATGTTSVTVNTSPSGVTAAATPTTLCAGGSISLSSSYSSSGVTGMNNYSATRSTGTSFSSIIPATTITTWRNAVNTDDNLSNDQPIGFSFVYNGVPYSNFRVSTNGFLTFNTSSTAIGSGTGAYGYSNSWIVSAGGLMVAPNWDDLQTAGNLGTLTDLNNSINYTTTGSSPNRVLTVEWNNMQDFSTTSTASYNFQVKLYEADSHLEFVYGTMTQSAASVSYSLGLSAATVSTTPVAAELLSQSTVNTGSFGFTNQNSLTPVPASNTRISFAAPAGTISWSGPGSFTSAVANPTATATTSGSYTVTITNTANSCTASASVAVTVNPLPVVSGTTTAATCFGASTGSISASSTGTAPYTFTLNGINPNSTGSYTSLAAGTYTVASTDANGCTGTASFTITQPTAVSVSASGTPTTCFGGADGSATFSASGGTAPYSYTLNGNASTSPATGLAAGSYTIVATDANGCTGSTTVTITSPAALTVSATNTGPVCEGFSFTLNGSAGFSTYAWSGPLSYSASGQSVTVSSATPAMSGTYSVLATAANGCTATATTTVTVNATPATPTVSVSAASICAPGTITFTSSHSGAGNVWTPGGATTASVTASGAGSYSYSVVYTDGNGCISAASAAGTGVIYPANAVSITPSTGTFCVSTVLTSSVTGGNVWSTTETTDAITVTSSNTYSVTNTDANGCSAVASAAITINPTAPVSVSLSVPNTSICSGQSSTFTATATNGGPGATYEFFVGGISQGAATTSNTFTYNPANGDVVSCVVVSNATCNTGSPATSNSLTMNVTGSVPASVSLSASATNVCAGSSVTLTATPTNGGTPTYEFFLNGTSQGAAGASNTFTYTPSANANATVVMTSSLGCATGSPATSNTVSITSIATPAAPTVTVSSATACAPATITFTSSYSSGNTWTPGGATTQSISASTPGSYSYTVVYTDAFGCVSPASAPATATIYPANAVSITPSSATFCGSGVLTSSVSGGNVWSTTETTNAITVSTSGTYTVVNTDVNGCTASASSVITVNSIPTAPTITASSSTICAPGTITLTSSYSGAGNVWSPGGATTDNIIVSGAGTYTYTVTYTSSGCSATSSPITVTIFPANSVTIAASNSGTLCSGGTVTLTATPSTGNVWSTTETTAAITVNAAGTYSVTNTDANGCVATASSTVVSSAPTASITATCTNLLAGNSTTFTTTATAGTGTITSYQYVLNGVTSVGTNSATFTTSTAGSYTVIVTNSSNCTVTAGPIVIENTSPLNGNYTIGAAAACTNFTSFANAFTSLNARGVSGNVTVTIAAGYTETVAAGGLTLNQCALAANLKTGSTRTLTFVKSGASANPLITTTGTAGLTDGVIKLVGTDNVTFNGISVADAGATIEWGYALLKCTGNDGANSNTIINCGITLAKTLTGSVGIYSGNHTGTSTTGLTYSGTLNDPTEADASRNGRNTFYGNTISNVYTGISLNGNASSSSNQSLNDTLNEVGQIGQSANVITNFGGGSVAINGITETNQRGLKINNNTITLTSGTGVGTGITIGISSTSGGWGEVRNNAVTLVAANTTNAITGISQGFSAGSLVNPNTVTVTGNTVSIQSSTVTTGTMIGINCTASGTGSVVTCSNNTVAAVGTLGAAAATAAFTGIIVSNGSTSSVQTASNNTVNSITTNGTGTFTGINLTGSAATATLTAAGNSVSSNTKNSTGTLTAIAVGHSSTTLTASLTGSTITGNTMAGGAAACTFNGITLSTAIWTVTGNTINNNNLTAITGIVIGTFTGISSIGGSVPSSNISGNTISNMTIGGGSTGNHIIRGINASTSTADARTINGNTIFGFSVASSSTTPAVTGIITGTGGTVNVTKNKIYGLTVNGSAGTAIGISNTGGTTVGIINNIIGAISAPNLTNALASNSIIGLSLTGGTTVNASYNTIFLSGTSTGGSSGISYTITPTTVTLRNNIVSNSLAQSGPAFSVAVRCATITVPPANFGSASNNNLYYTTGVGNNLTSFNGTAGFAFAAYKSQVGMAPREQASVTENVATNLANTTTGASANYLHFTASAPSLAESGAIAISGITDDYDGDVRNATSPDIGADEFTGVPQQPYFVSVTISPSTIQCTATARLVTATMGGPVITSATLNYAYNGGTVVPVTMVNTSGTIWEGTIPAATPVNATVTWSISATNGTYSPSYIGASYSDSPLTGVTLATTSTPSVVCLGSSSNLSVQATGGSVYTGTYTVASVPYSLVATPGSGVTTLANGGVASTALTLGSLDDGYWTISLPFGFNFFGTSYTTASIGTNGNIQFGTLATAGYNSTLPSATAPNGVFAALFGDLNTNVGTVNFFVTGTTPNRVLVVNWTGVNWFSATPSASFQAKLYESTNVCETHITSTTTGNGHAVGVENQAGTVAYVPTNRNNGTWAIATPEAWSFTPQVSVTYSWFNGATQIASSSTTTVTPSTATTYTAVATNGIGCTTSSTVTVNVNPLPGALTLSPSSQCGTGVPTAAVTAGGGGFYLWYLVPSGGTPIQNSSSTTLTSYAISATTTFYVSEFDGTCEGPRTAVTATVSSPVAVAATASVATSCPFTNVTLSASSANDPNYVYTWTASPVSGSGIPTSVSGTSVVIQGTAAGTFTYTVNGYDGTTQCQATATVQVTYTTPPAINSVTASPTGTICPSTSVTLTAVTGTVPPTSPTAYSFAASSGTYAPLVGGTASTAAGDDGTQTSIPIGFTFNYNGINQTTFGISTNGTIQLGTTATSFTNNLAGIANVITPFWDDHNLGTGTITYLTNGTVGSRILSVQWSNIAIGGGGTAANPTGTFQVKLYEGSNKIEFYYGGFQTMSATTASIGISGSVGSYISVTPGAPATTSSAVENNAINANTFLPSGTIYTFTAPAQPGPGTFTWSWNPGALSGNVVTVAPTATTTYTVQAYDAVSGCSNFSTIAVNVFVPPAAPGTLPSVQCGTAIPTASVSGAGTGTYRWYLASTGGSPIQSSAATSLTSYVISAPTTFYVSIFDGNCEGPRASVLADVVSPDAISATANPTIQCGLGGSIALSATQTGSNQIYSYTWNGTAGSGASATPGQNVSVTPTAFGTYVYTVTATDGGCVTTATTQVVVAPNPTITSISATPAAICFGSSTTLNASTTTIDNGPQTVTATYASSSATNTADEDLLNVTFGTLNNTSTCATTGGAGSVLNLYSNYTSVAAPTVAVGQSVAFSVQTGTCGGNFTNRCAIFIDWNRDGDFIDANENPFVSTAVLGPNTVSGSITVPATALAGVTRMRVITVETSGTITSTGTYTWGETEDYNIQVQTVITQPNVSVTWNPGALSGNTVTVTPGTTGANTYTATATNSLSGCSSSQNVVVNVNPLPSAPSAVGSTQCGYGVPTATVTGSGGLIRWYLTSTGGTAIAGQTGSQLSGYFINSTTTFYVSEFDGTCESSRVPVVATVTQPDAVSITASSSSACTNSPITLTAVQTGTTNTYTYTWSTNGGTNAGLGSTSGTSVTATPLAVGTYTYSVVANDGTAGCATLASITVTTNQSPSVTVLPSTASICQNSSVTLNATGLTNGSSMVLNGTNQYMTVANSTSLNLTTNITLEAWIRPSAFSALAGIISKYQVSGQASYFLREGGTSPYTAISAGANTGYTGGTGVMSANNWYYVAAQFKNNGANDSVYFAVIPASGVGGFIYTGGTTTIAAVTNELRVGSDFGGRFFTGQIDQVRIWNAAIPFSTLLTWWNSPISGSHPNIANLVANYDFNTVTGTTVPDLSGNGNNGTLMNGALANGSNAPIGGNAISYLWSPSTGLSSTTTASTIATPTTPGTVVYTVTATSTNGCTATATATLNVNPQPAAPTLVSNSTQCGLGVPTASVSGSGGSFRWYLNGTTTTPIAGEIGTSLTTYSISTTTTFYVSEFDGTCESPRTAVTATVLNPDAISASGPATACGNSTITLTATNLGTTNVYSYSWSSASTGSGITGSLAGNPVNVTPTTGGTIVYTVIATDGSCTTSATVSVAVTAPPVISSSTATPSSICPLSSTTLTASSLVLGTGPQTLPATYCVPVQSGSSCVSSVIINTLNSTPAACATPFYRINPATGANTTTLTAGQSYTMTLSTSGTSIISVWIDYNRDGIFAASEWVQPWIAAATGTVAINVPGTAASGLTGMRIRSRLNGNTNGAVDACTSFGSGSTEDYTVEIISNVPDPNVSFVWNPGALSGASVSASPSVSTTYTVTATNSVTGCTSSASVPVTVITSVGTPVATATPATICGTGTTSLSVTSPVSGLTYSWEYSLNGTTGWTAMANGTTITSQTLSSNMYFHVIATCGTATDVSAAILVTVSNPNITSTPSVTRCGPGTVVLTVTGNGSFDWYATSSSTTPLATNTSTFTTTVVGSTSFWVIAYIGTCTDAAGRQPVQVNVTPAPAITVSATPTTICLGGTVALTVTSPNDPNYSYAWSTNGGPAGTGASLTVSPTASVVYTLTANDGTTGCGNVGTVSVTVLPVPPTPILTNSNPLNCSTPGNSTLTATNSTFVNPNGFTVATIPYAPLSSATPTPGPTGDDVVSSALPIGFSFTYYGNTYTNFYISTNGFVSFGSSGAGCCAGQLLPNTATPNDVIALCWTDLNTASGGTIDYFNLTSPNRLVVRFNGVAHFAGTPQINGQIILYQNGNIEMHTASLNAQGTYTQGVENLTGTIAAVSPGLNATTTTTLTNTSYLFDPIAAYTVTWAPPTGLSSTSGSSVVATPTTTTTYTATYTSSNGCTSSASTTVTVTPLTPPTITASGSTTICEGGNVTLDAGSGYSSYSWSDGTSVVGTSQTYAAMPTATTSYTVTVGNGTCTATATQTVTVQPLAAPSITSSLGATFCQPGSTTLSVPNVYATYAWSNGGTSFSTTASTSGTYTVTVAASNGCTATASIGITANPVPTATVSPTGPVNLCDNGSNSPVTLTVTSSATNIQWNDIDGTTGSTLVVDNNSLDLLINGNTFVYQATVTENGCATTVSVTVNVVTCTAGVALNAKMYFEGYYQNPGSPTPMDNLGLGGCLFVNGMSANPNDADYVSISLMNASTYALVESATGTLHIDGTVSVNFTTATAGTSYFIKVTHRNAVETWSSSPVLFSSITTYNFTTNATQAYGNNMIEVEPGIWAFYSGDIADANIGVGSQDGVIESTDYSEMENAVYSILSGYVFEDISGDGVVESTDYSIMENNVYSIISTIHP